MCVSLLKDSPNSMVLTSIKHSPLSLTSCPSEPSSLSLHPKTGNFTRWMSSPPTWTALLTLPSTCACQKFVRFYVFSHFELFLPMNTHSSYTCFHLHYAPTTCYFPFIPFHFHHSHQVWTIENTSEVDSRIYQKQQSIYLQRFFLPETFSHPIPYRKILPNVNFDTHSSTNPWWDPRSWGIESKETLDDGNPSPQDEEVIGGRIGIGTLFSILKESSPGENNGRSSMYSMALALHLFAALRLSNLWYDIPPINDPSLGVACLLWISNLLCGAVLSLLGDEPGLWPCGEQCCPVCTGPT